MGGRLGVPGWTGHAGGRFRAGPPVSAAGPPLPRAWGPRPPAAGSSGRTARRSKCAPHTGSAGWALVPRSSSGFAALELYWPLSGCSLGNGPALRRAWTRPQLGPCKQGPQEPRPHLLQARLPSGPLGLHGGCTLVRRGAAGPAPASVGALRPQLRQVALSPPRPAVPSAGSQGLLLCVEVSTRGSAPRGPGSVPAQLEPGGACA